MRKLYPVFGGPADGDVWPAPPKGYPGYAVKHCRLIHLYLLKRRKMNGTSRRCFIAVSCIPNPERFDGIWN